VSTILKALRRLEEERTAPVGRRPLREEVAHAADSPRPRRGAWAIALGALAGGVAVGVALLTVWPRDVAREQPEQPLVRAPAPPARPPRAAPAEPEAQGLSDAALASPVKVVARPGPKPLVVDEPEPAPTDRVAAAAPPPPAAHGRRTERLSAPAVASPPPSDADALARARSAPPIAPGIRVEQTFWHPRPNRRVAVLTLPGREQPLRVHEGDAVGALVVSEIEPSGVVFTQQGQQVRRALGEAP
jgi:hypothetical protein